MVELYRRFYIGNNDDAMNIILRNKPNWAILHCAKEPWHREMLRYTSKGAPKDDPEYLYAIRKSRMALNMVDSEDPKYFSFMMVKAGLDFMENKYKLGFNVLCHCNEGRTRSPVVGMLFMATRLKVMNCEQHFHICEVEFRNKYPNYEPRNGIREHVLINWNMYLKYS